MRVHESSREREREENVLCIISLCTCIDCYNQGLIDGLLDD